MADHDGSAREESSGGGMLRRALRRITASEQQLDAEDLQDQVDEAGATPCSQACQLDQQEVRLVGRLRSVRFTPRTTTPTLEAELYDGTGSVGLIWLGRRRIAGIEPGRCVVVRGRLAECGSREVIYNPWYELLPTGP